MTPSEKIEQGFGLLAEGLKELPRSASETKAGPYAFPGQFSWRIGDLQKFWDENKSRYSS